MAGVSRLQYTAETRLIRVMCSGRVDPKFILGAFAKGLDGVFVGGCRLNECNYVTQGNFAALNMVLLCKKILEHTGLHPERLRVAFLSAGEGNLFAEALNDFGKQVRALGPLGKGEGMDAAELRSRLEVITRQIPYIKMVKKEKLRARHEKEEDHDDFFTVAEIDQLLNEIISYYIDPEKCQACMICLRKCYVNAILGGKDRIHVIDQERCIKCGNCLESCPPRFGAVKSISGAAVPVPIPEAERTIVRKNKKVENLNL